MPLSILSVDQMREWEESSWAAGATESAVISQVGAAIAHRLVEFVKPGGRLLFLAGKGHNGDDVRAAARAIRCAAEVAGIPAESELIDIQDPARDRVPILAAIERRPAWIVDGLFGIGLNRPLSAEWVALIEAINARCGRVFAVDVPSGLNADTGGVWGAALRSEITLTVGAVKQGLIAPAAADWVGQIEVARNVGLIGEIPTSKLVWTLPDDFADYPARRSPAAHKGSFGHLAILAGSIGYHGAGVLTARAAVRARPGLVTLATMPDVFLPVASQLQQVMVRPWQPSESWPEKITALLMGPGLAAPGLRERLAPEIVKLWHQAKVPVVVDATALEWLPLGTVENPQARVITPHPGEAARLLRCGIDQVQADRPAAVRALSKRFGCCWVVLKGQHTLIGRAEGTLYVNSSGNSGLAQGGSGDVLAGLMGGLLAQPSCQIDPLTAVRYAVWHHGVTADRLERERNSWNTEELVDAL